MADQTTITPEAARAIMLHLQGGGDPAHSMAVASGAITPELAQQLAMQGGDPTRPLTLPEMHGLLAQQNTPVALGAPQLQLDPSLTGLDQAPNMGADSGAAAPPPAVQFASSMPMVQPRNDQQLAENVVGGMAEQGAELRDKSSALNMAAVAQSDKAAKASIEAASAKKELDKSINEKSRQVLQASNDQIGGIDQQEYDALKQRQDTMDKILGNMLTSANEAAQVAPHDFWYNRSTSSKIFAVISQIAAGTSNGLANQPGAQTPIDRLIEGDLNQQRLAFAQKSQESNQNSGIYNDLVKANESQTAAYGALRVAAYKRVLAQLQQASLDDPNLKANADYQAAVANAQSKLAETLQATSKQLGEQAADVSKAAATSATSLGTTEMKAKSAEHIANIEGDFKLRAAEATADGSDGPSWNPAGIRPIEGKEPIPVDKSQRPIILKTMAAADVIQHEVHHVEAVLAADKAMQPSVKAALLAQSRATIVREIGAGFNAGNRPADIYGAMVAGGVPKSAAQSLLSYFTAEDLSPEATLAAMKATAASVRYNVNAQLKPFNRELAE